MSHEENKDIVRRFHDGMLEFFRTGNLVSTAKVVGLGPIPPHVGLVPR